MNSTSAARDVVRRGTARKARALDRKDIAGKTGTTNDQRDAGSTVSTRNLVAITPGSVSIIFNLSGEGRGRAHLHGSISRRTGRWRALKGASGMPGHDDHAHHDEDRQKTGPRRSGRNL
ncbi:hypothetical protein [endosymbiont of Lamellibrachia barhami]|uniref:hypothetical protein n=1 Tax=endosymbiont of Lamellibrachia barhami TaxID=205975 RepID=UPI0015AC0A06|nr:hypothetical protein [endosymbiont of Lamellibrachia barhami]